MSELGKYQRPMGRVYRRMLKSTTGGGGGRKYKNPKKMTAVISRGPSLIPDKYTAKLKYTAVMPTEFAATSFKVYQFRGNSLFDPDKTGSGHQPYGFDELSNMYGYYRVHGCRIHVSCLAGSSTEANAMAAIAIFPTAQDDVPTDLSVVLEAPRTKYKLLNVSTGAGAKASVQGYRSTSQVMGLNKMQASDEDLGALVSANPSKQWYWEIIGGTLDSTSNIVLELVVTLTYYCTFSRRKDLGQS